MNYRTERALIDVALMVLGACLVAGLVYVIFSFVLWKGLPSEWSMDARMFASMVWVSFTVAVCGLVGTRR